MHGLSFRRDSDKLKDLSSIATRADKILYVMTAITVFNHCTGRVVITVAIQLYSVAEFSEFGLPFQEK